MDITLGIEEELMVVDPHTCDVIGTPDPRIFEECCRNAGEHRIVNEFLLSQIETNSKVCASIAELRSSLYELRSTVIDAAGKHGAAIIASSTHPWARWQVQQVTPKDRYQQAEIEYQQSVRQFLVNGMHIHAGFGDADQRVRVMTALRQFLPVFLAASTSSPFHAGQLTGLKSYRQVLIRALPRTGMPRAIGTWEEYEQIVKRYLDMRAIKDGSELRWDIRPSAGYPTIELRICDICPRVEDAISLAALYACLIRYLARKLEAGEPLPEASQEMIEENCWLAQRFGTLTFLPLGNPARLVDVEDHVKWLIEELREDAGALDCEREVAHVERIIHLGSSANRQEDVYLQAKLDGMNEKEAMKAVVQMIIDETGQGA